MYPPIPAPLGTEISPAPVLGSGALRKGLVGFVVFTVAGLLLIFQWKPPAGLTGTGIHPDWRIMAITIPLVFMDYLLGGIRFRLFFDGSVLPRISLWDCMRSNWGNLFMGVVTPFSTGGGPAQIYILWKKGASVFDSLLVSLINFIATLLFLLVAGVAVVYLLPGDLFGSGITAMIRTSAVAVTGLSAAVFFTAFFPKTGLKITTAVVLRLPFHFFGIETWRHRLLTWLEKEVGRFDENFKCILARKKRALAITMATTLVLYFNKYVIGYVIARSMVADVPAGTFIGLEILNYFVSFMAPTPGASGIAEVSSVWLMEKVLSAEVLLAFAALFRLVTVIVGAGIGGFVLVAELKSGIRRVSPEDGK